MALRRPPHSRRTLANQKEIEAVCSEAGFEPIDPGRLSLDEQIELFRSTRYIVAEHGSACANIIFRRGAQLSMIELFPPDYDSTAFYLNCRHLGFSHTLLRGSPVADGCSSWRMSPEKLRSALIAMLDP